MKLKLKLEKLVFDLVASKKIKLPHGKNLGSPLQMQNSHSIKHNQLASLGKWLSIRLRTKWF